MALILMGVAHHALAADAPPPTIADLALLLKSYAPDKERIRRLQAERDKPLPATADSGELALAWHRKALAAEELGDPERWLEALDKALEQAMKLPPSNSADVGSVLRLKLDRAQVLRTLKGLSASLAEYEALMKEHEGKEAGWMIPIWFQLASGYVALGDLDRARKVVAHADAVLKTLLERPRIRLFAPGWKQFIERARGFVFRAEGKLDEEEQAFQKAVALSLEEIRASERRREMGLYAAPPDKVEGFVDLSRLALAGVYVNQLRLDEGELLLREILKSSLKRSGPNSRLTGNVLRALAQVYAHRGRLADAAVVAEWADASLADAGFSTISPERLVARLGLANYLAGLGRHPEAVALYDAVRRDVADDSRLDEGYSVATLNSIRSYLAVDRYADAEKDADAILGKLQRSLGADHYDTAEARAYRAMVLYRTGRVEMARKEFERAVAVLIDPTKSAGKQQTSSVRSTRLRLILNDYLSVLAGSQGTSQAADRAEAFRIADVARWQSVQKAVTGSALRAAAGSSELGALIKKVQDADDELQAVYKNLIAQRSAPPDRQLPQVIAAMEDRIATLRREQQKDLTEIRRQFPQYDDLVNPRPADEARVRKSLRPNEVLLSVYVTPGGSYVWALGASGALRFHFSPQPAGWVLAQVRKLRESVDLSAAYAPEKLRFDLTAADALYRELLGPVAAAWEGDPAVDTLLVVANDALGQIPFSLLPTASAPEGKDDAGLPLSRYRRTPWLARKLAVAYLPSVSAFVTLRGLPPPRGERAPFIGFGDPDFGASAAPTAPPGATSRAVRRLRSSAPTLRDERASPDLGGLLAPLPDTRDEITAIAKALRADPARDAYFGADANLRNVMSADLRHRRIVAFATHGLVAGDLPGLDQPALALSPSAGKGIDDGLLRLEHILKLSLDADLVVLSACNTAAADGNGAEAVSGLGRGFFYAGSRAVLATHWPVETVSARQLMVRLFEGYGAEAGLTRAQALRRAMLELIDKEVARDEKGRPALAYAHPAFWAPYALYGDPGR